MRRADKLKAREILRLKKAGLSLRDIAKSTGCGKPTVLEVLSWTERANGYIGSLGPKASKKTTMQI
jgi:DNA invertase Pin-like site-specific DNA recombinase